MLWRIVPHLMCIGVEAPESAAVIGLSSKKVSTQVVDAGVSTHLALIRCLLEMDIVVLLRMSSQ
jgi:hypothetical protein